MPHAHIRRPSFGTVIALVALFVALGGPAQARKLIGGADIKRGAITAKHVKARSLTTSRLSTGTVRQLQATPAGEVTGAKLADGAVDGAKVADGALGGADIADGSLGGLDVADGALDAADIADGRLGGQDVGAFVGSLTDLDFGVISAGDCKQVATTSLQAVGPGSQDLRDDAIVVTPAASLPTDVSIFARAASANQIGVVICNLSGGDLNLGQRTFRYITFDAVR